MAAGGKSKGGNSGADSKGRKRKHYLPHNKPVKKRGYPLRPGVQGFFITCDGGRERQASQEAINVIDTFFEELVHGNGADGKPAELLARPTYKKIKFEYSESSSGEDDEDGSEEADGNEDADEQGKGEGESEKDADSESLKNETADAQKEDGKEAGEQAEAAVAPGAEKKDEKEVGEQVEAAAPDADKKDESAKDQAEEAVEPPVKKQCLDKDSSNPALVDRKEEKSVDQLIEAELEELADKSKRRFVGLDSGCNGVVIVQMRKRGGEPGPREIVQHMMTSAASTRKHMSRFILRVLPIEVSCYASEEEITRAIVPLVEQYFPIETENPQKFAVLYDARANSGIDRMKIINSVAKSIPGPHKVDLNNPDKTIVVQIVKTVCLIGVVEKYKELSKYNLRQLTSPNP